MDTEPQENSEVKPPPSQETVDNILTAVDELASTGSFGGTSWDQIFWLKPLKGWDKYSRLFVSRLTERGRKVHPHEPEAKIEFLSRDELGKKTIAYNIWLDKELKLVRHNFLVTIEEDKDKQNRHHKLVYGSKQEKKQAMDQILEEISHKEESRNMENEVGVSYVDAEEAEVLLS